MQTSICKFFAYSFFAPVNEGISVRYANIRLELKKTGRPIPENDIWIVATCLELGVALLTEDTYFNYI
ncbi:MAG: type II toxin-antitoxin system VapC family toxin [Candidatus Altiarchaeum hamiconexum]|uniref:Type II toxin-antitoxin system VapC family toxin n=1 Tax=Candidatus Altarchaeum hamiconexum TaxID=1803513 RepID=A0A8J8CK66_9ARCH|nr:type II toxin-antitoxin system VapC family toxin [Candidatus Altarchaeum hamiconexum]NCN68509.1 type II toxin-antitoxin system VapC family toxin [Candidatus Altarchaeum hamiconexum]NCS91067.1 type II toxin-antitoxin system VapC family toxin [Candidatus Altarchaeum hamiconexum]NCT00658.1 type II toxin-antitoxin system VapC family toxin [Candidatus Altarchaeum hamiconexum]